MSIESKVAEIARQKLVEVVEDRSNSPAAVLGAVTAYMRAVGNEGEKLIAKASDDAVTATIEAMKAMVEDKG